MVDNFVFEEPSGRFKNFPENGCVVGHVTLKIFGIRQALLNLLIKQQILNIKNLSVDNTVKSDEVTHPKQHKSFFWDNVIERSHCTYNPLDMTPVTCRS